MSRLFDSDDEFERNSEAEQTLDQSVLEFLDCIPETVSVGKTSSFKRVKYIATGSFGRVYKALSPDGIEVALKRLNLHSRNNRRHELALRDSLREVKVLSSIQHPNIVKLTQVVTSSSNIYLAIEFCSELLLDLSKRKLPVPFIKSALFQLLSGLQYIHEEGFIHRDIKPDNIMIRDGVLKIADFGSCAKSSREDNWTPRVVTLWYRPPEVVLGSSSQTTTVDIWSAGCVLAEMILSAPLFPGHSEIAQINLIVDLLGTPTVADWPELETLPVLQCMSLNERTSTLHEKFDIEQSSTALLRKMLIFNPAERNTAEKCLAEEYFKEEPEMMTQAEVRDFLTTKSKRSSEGNGRVRKKLRLSSAGE